MKKIYRNILLIAGTGRNSGKTTLACNIIEKFSNYFEVTAVKISPHFHQGTNNLEAIDKSKGYNIYLETKKDNGKDSARMFKAGASKVYYVEVLDNCLMDAFLAIIKKIPPSSPVVCESPALRNYIIPGVFLVVDHPETKNKKAEILKWKRVADEFIDTSNRNTGTTVERLEFNKNGWWLK